MESEDTMGVRARNRGCRLPLRTGHHWQLAGNNYDRLRAHRIASFCESYTVTAEHSRQGSTVSIRASLAIGSTQ